MDFPYRLNYTSSFTAFANTFDPLLLHLCQLTHLSNAWMRALKRLKSANSPNRKTAMTVMPHLTRSAVPHRLSHHIGMRLWYKHYDLYILRFHTEILA